MDVHTPYSKYMRQSFDIIYSLKYDVSPNTLPHVGVEFLYEIIFPYGGNKVECLVSYSR